eukprot:5809620-Prymnesium_polylepis.1
MKAGLDRLKARAREAQKRLKFLANNIDSYRHQLEVLTEALRVNIEAKEAEEELQKKKENVPLEVLIGEGLTGGTAATLMKMWEK